MKRMNSPVVMLVRWCKNSAPGYTSALSVDMKLEESKAQVKLRALEVKSLCLILELKRLGSKDYMYKKQNQYARAIRKLHP